MTYRRHGIHSGKASNKPRRSNNVFVTLGNVNESLEMRQVFVARNSYFFTCWQLSGSYITEGVLRMQKYIIVFQADEIESWNVTYFQLFLLHLNTWTKCWKRTLACFTRQKVFQFAVSRGIYGLLYNKTAWNFKNPQNFIICSYVVYFCLWSRWLQHCE